MAYRQLPKRPAHEPSPEEQLWTIKCWADDIRATYGAADPDGMRAVVAFLVEQIDQVPPD